MTLDVVWSFNRILIIRFIQRKEQVSNSQLSRRTSLRRFYLPFRHRLNPSDEQACGNIHDPNNPKHLGIMRAIVPCDQEIDDAAKVTRSTCDTGDEACSTNCQFSSLRESFDVTQDSPLNVGCTWGSSAKTEPFPASSKNANPVINPIIVALL